MNYAIVTKTNNCPSKKQGLLLTDAGELQTEEYVLAVARLIGPDKTTHFAKSNKKHISIHLINQTTADEFVKKYNTIYIKNIPITVRLQHSPHKRIVISNACATIPHQIIEEELRKIKLKLTSNMEFVRAGLQYEGFKHTFSSRRHVFIDNEDQTNIPEYIDIEYENMHCRLYITDDSYYCPICRKHGHKNEKCRYRQRTENNQNLNLNRT